jgi:hypothetical protein
MKHLCSNRTILEKFKKEGDTKGRSPTEATRLRLDKKKLDYSQFMASRHRIVVALVGEAPLRNEGSTSRRL